MLHHGSGPASSGKGANLQTLQKAGFNVPKFIILTSTQAKNPEAAALLAQKTILGHLYAVRSNSALEDSLTQSQAGQFLTKLRVKPVDLAAAIQEVESSASSVIVQEFIEPQVSGVLFTRNPKGGHEMVLEWLHGHNEDLVSGQRLPTQLKILRFGQLPAHLPSFVSELRQLALQIETLFGRPQDIEWCIKAGQVFILQARPITTRTAAAEQLGDFLDQHLPLDHFYWAQTEATESAPHPDRETLILLDALWQPQGPIARAYVRLGIKCAPGSPFRLLGGTLYVDREHELRQIFPAMSYFTVNGQPGFVRLWGIFTTLSHMSRLRRPVCDPVKLVQEIAACLAQPVATSASAARQKFSADYELVYLANILASSLPGEPSLPRVEPPNLQTGNSLNLLDITPFRPANTLSLKARDQLREYGRWLMCQRLEDIRRYLPLDALAPGDIEPVALPIILRSQIVEDSSKPQGISPGIAQGQVTFSLAQPNSAAILVVETLSPQLAPCLSQFAGVVSARGGTLSHLAIIAREQKIPVVSGYDITSLKEGIELMINGDTGEIVRL